MTHRTAIIFEDWSSFITDLSGEAVQHLQYLPFGESFITQTSTSWQTRYTFSGKEKDDEIERRGDSRTPLKIKQESEQTGYSYFGARYYDSELSVWLSVDPLDFKYPNESPYSYVGNRPINTIDPWGMDKVEDPNGNTGEAGDYKQTKDKKYLYGNGLKTKVWDPNYKADEHYGQNGGGMANSKQKGGYVDYNGPDIDFENYGKPAPSPISNTSNSKSSNIYNGIGVSNFSTSQTNNFKYNYGSPARPLGAINPIVGKSQFDCSAWVYYCVYQYHPALAKAMGSSSSSIKNYATKYGGIRTVKPLVGDIAIWGGHVEIITSVNGSMFYTSGASGKVGASIPTSKNFNNINDPKLKWYGNGSFYGFWTPTIR